MRLISFFCEEGESAMTRGYFGYLFVLPIVATTLLVIGGCSPDLDKAAEKNAAIDAGTETASKNKTESGPAASEAVDEHGHAPGAHGGIMVSLGRDSYHVEAVIDSAGSVRLYTLGNDESRVIDVESQTLQAFVKAAGDTDSKSMSFLPSPQEGDGPGKTSLFVGKLPQDLVGGVLDVTIPNIRIDGERFRLGFTTQQAEHATSSEMPTKVANDAEHELYLTPGGHYTPEDIKANGNLTASQKFKGMKAQHDMKPKVGDVLCPISGTKANPKFSWTIGGKAYTFCCPPCVDEFLSAAKSSTDPLPDPDTLIKK